MRKIRLDASTVFPILGVMLSTGLAGCVAHYRVPSDAPYASVRLITNTDENTTFSVVDPARCPEPARPLVLAGMGRQLAAMGRDRGLDMAGGSPEPPARTRERKVAVGKRVFVAVTSMAAAPAEEIRCAAGVSFVPQAGAQYEIRYSRDDTASQCAARVLRLQPRADGGAVLVQEGSQQGFRALRREYVCDAPGVAPARAGE